MDLHARKIHFVQEFLRLNNEKLIAKFERILTTEKKKLYEEGFSPMSMSEFNERIDNAEDDALNGRVKDVSELDREIDSWT